MAWIAERQDRTGRQVRVRGYHPFLFFFQAEDGIRDVAVTGVQTCALPILRSGSSGTTGRSTGSSRPRRRRGTATPWIWGSSTRLSPGWMRRGSRRCARRWRSEERRVGKEGRSRWAAYHLKKKKEVIADYER